METTRDSGTSITVAVVEAVSTFEDCEPTALPPLYDAVDTDALNSLFTSATDDRDCHISFSFSDSRVAIENGERIVVEADTAQRVRPQPDRTQDGSAGGSARRSRGGRR